MMKKITLLSLALLTTMIASGQTENLISETGGVNDPVVYVNQNFEQDPCWLSGPSNDFENGKSCTQNLGRIVAHDVVVFDSFPTGYYLDLEEIRLNAFIGEEGSGINAAFVDVYVYTDADGSPGTLFASELGFIPTDQILIGANFGFDIWELILDIPDIFLEGDSGTKETTFWIGLSIEATDGSNVFWENSTEFVYEFGEAYDDGSGGGFVVDETLEGVYVFSGDCPPILGVGGNLADLLNIYPNPVTTRLNMEVPAGIEITDIALYDMLGKNMGVALVGGSIDVSNLSRGVYILNIKSTQGALTKKVIKR